MPGSHFKITCPACGHVAKVSATKIRHASDGTSRTRYATCSSPTCSAHLAERSFERVVGVHVIKHATPRR